LLTIGNLLSLPIFLWLFARPFFQLLKKLETGKSDREPID
jgi:hypothetical protein